jgi:hypothetical protein
MESVAGIKKAAPSPITARAPMRGPVECTKAQASEPPPNMAVPIRKRRRRPNRSPSAPPNRSSTALVRV